jgi:alanine racemase
MVAGMSDTSARSATGLAGADGTGEADALELARGSGRAVWPGRRGPGHRMNAVMALAIAAPNDCARGAVLTVDLHAVAANTRFFAARTRAELMAVVKADGFGHGGAEAARTALANGATWLGVTSIAEGVALREAGLTAPMLTWLNPVDADFRLRGQQIHPGEAAIVFGPGTSGEPTVADWAAWAGTIEHEIVTGIGARVRRHVTGAGQGSAR